MADLTNAMIFGGIATGAAQSYQDNFSPRGQAAKAEAHSRKAAADEQLRRTQATRATEQDLSNMAEAQSSELEVLKQENNRMVAEGTKRTVFEGFDRFIGDNDPRHLNTMLNDAKKNQYGQKLFGKFTRVDKLTETDKDLIVRSGLDPELVLSDPDVAARFLKVTNNDGSQMLTDIHSLFKMTGYTQYASDRELGIMKKKADIFKAYKDTNGLAKTAKERLAYDQTIGQGLQPGTPEFEAAYLANRANVLKSKGDSGDADPATEFKTEAEREALRLTKLDGIDPMTRQGQERFMQHYDSVQTRKAKNSAIKSADEVDAATQRVDALASSLNTDFFDIDFSNPAMRRRFEPDVQRIEKLGGFELSADQRKELGYVKSLIALGPPALELTDKETGAIDNIFHDAKKYISDNVGGTAATSAYSTFRNVIRHALYGAALTESEIASFNDQFGNLRQKRGPVLAQLKTAVEQVKAKLDGVQSLGNSYVAHFRLGADADALEQIINNLDTLVSNISTLQHTDSDGDAQVLGTEDIQQLDSLFGVSQ
jgi:hypothetical protein